MASLEANSLKRKNSPVPLTHRIKKRPPLRPAIPSPYTGRSSPKVVYIKAHTPFIAAVKRTQSLLAQVAKREQGMHGPTDDEILAAGRIGAAPGAPLRAHVPWDASAPKGEEVLLKGTGRAIQRVLELGLWFQDRPEYCTRVSTGEVTVIDDIVALEDTTDGIEDESHDVQMTEVDSAELPSPNVPDTRLRKLSVIEVAISWR